MKLGSFENKKWQSCYWWTTTGLHEWTGGPFMEPYVLLENISILQLYGAAI